MKHIQHPLDHADRFRLNDELHARPPVALWPNEHVLYLALVGTAGKRLQEEVLIRDLCDSLGGDACPLLRGNSIEFDVAINPEQCPNGQMGLRFRVKYERHSEFSSWWFFQQTASNDLNTEPVFFCDLNSWVRRLPGELLVAMNIRVCQVAQLPSVHDIAPYFSGNTVIGGLIARGAGAAYTDFRIDTDGRSNLLFMNQCMGSRQAGRQLQGLVEIETYRMMALLTLPDVQAAFPQLAADEQALVEVSHELAASYDAAAEDQSRDLGLQQKISRISSSVEALSSKTQFRLSASDAYFELVQKRISDLNETNLSGIQGFGEFMERRLLPAMKTCRTFAQRLRETSNRVSRISQLLQTRVEIIRENQNSQLLASMEKRSKQQLHLQQAVEGLSIVAISYYGIGIAGYLFKGLKTMGLLHDVELATCLVTPVILILVIWLTRRIRRSFK